MRLTILPLLVIIVSIGAHAQTPPEIPLWENGAPGFEDRKNEPTEAKDWWIKNIHNPTLTVFLPPADKATGAAVVICPGGGHRELVIDAEGRDPALFLNSIGVAAFVLKYRLAREKNSPYTIEEHVKADAYRAMRMVRGNAKEWHLDPTRIGMLGFSAGGEVVALVAYEPGNGNPSSIDPIDRVNGKPDFQMLVYPGPLGIPASLPTNAPPAFLLAANDDACCSGPVITLLQKYHEAKIPVEAHIYTQGAHGFNMGYRSSLSSIKGWPQRMADWMSDNKYLEKAPASK